MPDSFTEGTYQDDFLVREFDKSYNRASFLAEGAVTKGMILANGTNATTQKKQVVAAGTGANAVALNDAADGQTVWVLVRGPVLLKRQGLTYGPSATTNQKAATDVLLAAVGLVVLTQLP